MKTLTIDAEFVRAAQACQAKKDTRYYLNGFLITSTGYIVATTGHYLYVGQYTTCPDDMPSEDTIVNINGNVPISSAYVQFESLSTCSGMATTNNGKAFMFDIIDGRFPDYQRIIPKDNRPVFTNGIALQAEYFGLIGKVFKRKNKAVIFEHGSEHECAVATVEGDDSFARTSKLVIMPIRHSHDWLYSDAAMQNAA